MKLYKICLVFVHNCEKNMCCIRQFVKNQPKRNKNNTFRKCMFRWVCSLILQRYAQLKPDGTFDRLWTLACKTMCFKKVPVLKSSCLTVIKLRQADIEIHRHTHCFNFICFYLLIIVYKIGSHKRRWLYVNTISKKKLFSLHVTTKEMCVNTIYMF